MITSRDIVVNSKKYVCYAGVHDELRDMLKEGDLATLLMQNEDNTENIKVRGVVKHVGDVGVHMSVCGFSKVFNIEGDCCYKVTLIKRPVENLRLPDKAGLWQDSNGAIWLVDYALRARYIRNSVGTWVSESNFLDCSDYGLFAPFTKITSLNVADPDF